MTGKVKNSIAILLTIIILFPTVIQFTDGLFHHHEHAYQSLNHKQQLHHFHKKCPIAGFEIAPFTNNKVAFKSGHFQIVSKFVLPQLKYILNRFIDYSFLLRAPPPVL